MPRGTEVQWPERCGAGCQPAAYADVRGRRVDNPPQVDNLPHKSVRSLAPTCARIRGPLQAKGRCTVTLLR
jgi:hypothetical protein